MFYTNGTKSVTNQEALGKLGVFMYGKDSRKSEPGAVSWVNRKQKTEKRVEGVWDHKWE